MTTLQQAYAKALEIINEQAAKIEKLQCCGNCKHSEYDDKPFKVDFWCNHESRCDDYEPAPYDTCDKWVMR